MSVTIHDPREDLGRFGDLDPDLLETEDYKSVENFAEAAIEDDDLNFDWRHLAALAWNLRRDRAEIRKELISYGLRFVPKPQGRRIRTIGDNPHDRWYGPGSSPTHGGSGWEQVAGFAGQEG